MSSNQADEGVKEQTNGHKYIPDHEEDEKPTNELPLEGSLENKRKKKIDKRRKKVNALLRAATSMKEENVYMAAFERLDMVDTGRVGDTNIEKIRYLIKSNGLQKDDPRISAAMNKCEELERQNIDLNFDLFVKEFQP